MSLLCGHSAPYSATWSASGSMRNGHAFALRRSALPISESAFSSSRGLPTPRARDSKGRGFSDGLPTVAETLLPTPTTTEANGPGAMDGNRSDTLRSRVRLLKTPTSNLAVNGGSQHPDKRKGGGHGPNLADEVEHLLPTPRASDGAKGSPNQRMGDGSLTLASTAARLLPTPTATPYGSNQSPSPGASVRPSLEALPKLLPTPSASDHGSNYATAEERAAQGHQVYLSNATTSIGERTRKPSDGGSSEPGPLPGQLTIEAA